MRDSMFSEVKRTDGLGMNLLSSLPVPNLLTLLFSTPTPPPLSARDFLSEHDMLSSCFTDRPSWRPFMSLMLRSAD